MQLYQRPTPLTPEHLKYISIVGFTTVIVLGVTTCVALIFSLIWLLVQFILVLLQSTVGALNAIGATYTSADPFVKLLILAFIVFCLYRVYLKVTAGKVKL